VARDRRDVPALDPDRHGVAKLVPDNDTIERHARRVIEQRMTDRAIEKVAEEIAERVKASRFRRICASALKRR
jgi:hypothetical protein